jgi:hypothetical protein
MIICNLKIKDMQNFKIIIASLIGIGLFSQTKAQNADDAFRYSLTGITGTARYSSMGGAFGALGGDASVASFNPAGLAIYKRSELTITPSFYYQNMRSNFKNQAADDVKYNFNIGNFAYIGSINHGNNTEEGWINSTFGISYNRTNNFHSNISIEGKNGQSSLLDVWYNQAIANGGQNPSQLDAFGAGLAWQTYLLDTIPSDTINNTPWYYYSQINTPNDGITQRKRIMTSGGMGETAISYAGNYSNKIYIGATIGFPHINYSYNSTHEEETAKGDSASILKSFNYIENVRTRGNGFNFKIGLIYRINDYVRIGGALHTPSFYTMRDTWSSSVNAYYKDGTTFNVNSPNGSFDYTLNTPMRAIGSIAFIIAKKGIISADYEFVDYSSMRLSSTSYKYFNENGDIQKSYTGAGILRLGGELRADPFTIRAGYANWANAYQNNINNSSRNDFSIGLGIREKEYYFDFAYVLSTTSSMYYMYDPALISATKLTSSSNHIMVTVGFRY